MFFTISLTEYKMLHPDAAEFPILSQNGALAALLQKRRFKAARLALRQGKAAGPAARGARLVEALAGQAAAARFPPGGADVRLRRAPSLNPRNNT